MIRPLTTKLPLRGVLRRTALIPVFLAATAATAWAQTDATAPAGSISAPAGIPPVPDATVAVQGAAPVVVSPEFRGKVVAAIGEKELTLAALATAVGEAKPNEA